MTARRTGAEIGEGCVLEAGAEAWLGPTHARSGAIRVGAHCQVERGVLLHPWGGSIHLGSHVFLGPYTTIYGHGGVEIGDESLVAMRCSILSSNHTVPAPGTDIRSVPDVLRATKIGRDVWLGSGVTVLGGVTIGEGCVVGAGAVVTKSLPPNAIAIGIPAVVVGYR